MILRPGTNPIRKETFLLINGLIGIGLMALLMVISRPQGRSDKKILIAAAQNMDSALNVVRDYTQRNQINANNPEDPGRTGLIGPEWSELTTTLGDPAAKRTTLNPNFAALIAHLLLEAGVHKGDTVAIGSSASFPALLIASLSASKALRLHPVVIFSFGSSSFGASNPDFTLWDIYRLLLDNQLIDFLPAAASIGGEDDTGAGTDAALSGRLREKLTDAGIPLISESDLVKNVAARERVYFDGRPGRIRAFINSGGGYANLGSSPAVLKLRPGLIRKAPLPEPSRQGMIHAMLENNIPVIHLLFIKGIAQRYHLPWDPAARPAISEASVSFDGSGDYTGLIISLIGVIWFLLAIAGYRMLYNTH